MHEDLNQVFMYQKASYTLDKLSHNVNTSHRATYIRLMSSCVLQHPIYAMLGDTYAFSSITGNLISSV